MKLHNLLEEIVAVSVDEYFNTLSENKKVECDCEQCRLDVTCYVLNNMPPKYTVSARGLIHHSLDYAKKIQLDADILYHVKKGFAIVSQRKRVNLNHHHGNKSEEIENCLYFNFPNVIGKVINGTTFEPISDAKVTLFLDDAPVLMTSNLMENPIYLNKSTKGVFTFWPYPIEAEKIGEEKTFNYKITVNHPDFAEFIKLFEITAKAEANFLASIQLQNIKHLEDIFLFPKEE